MLRQIVGRKNKPKSDLARAVESRNKNKTTHEIENDKANRKVYQSFKNWSLY